MQILNNTLSYEQVVRTLETVAGLAGNILGLLSLLTYCACMSMLSLYEVHIVNCGQVLKNDPGSLLLPPCAAGGWL